MDWDAREGLEGILCTLGDKIFGPAKPLLLRVAIASPSNKPRSSHNAGACG